MKKIITLITALFTNAIAFSVPAIPDSLFVIQPNGDTLWTHLHGDEFYHWRSTIDGHVIMQDINSYFRYAELEGDSLLKPSNIIARNIEDRNVLEQQYIAQHSNAIKQFVQSEIQLTHALMETDSTILSTSQYAPNMNGDVGPVIGCRKILTILMEFEDYPFTKGKCEFDSLMNQKSGQIGLNYGSVWKFYQENSYGQLDVSSIVVGPFLAKKKRKKYTWKNNNIDLSYDVRLLVREAIDHAKNTIDFSTLDGDNDGYVDCIHVVFAGEGMSGGSNDSYIWEHQGVLYDPICQNGKKAKTYIITPELSYNGKIACVGTICHELGHVLGAPDYYDRNRCNGNFYANGDFDIMDRGSWNNKGHYPSHHNPFTKCYTFGWDTPTLISATTKNYILLSTTKNKGHFYRINTKTDGEYFLLENRTRELFDKHIPNSGLLIYHAHKDLEELVSKGKKINDTHPLKLYIINSSGITNPTNDTSSYGAFDAKRAFPGSNNDKTMFTSATIPSATAWDNQPTDVNICFIDAINGTITFTINPQIEGPTQLCGTQEYFISGQVPPKDIISWGYFAEFDDHRLFPGVRFPEGDKGNYIFAQRGYSMGQYVEDDSIIQDSSMIIVPTINQNTPSTQFPYIGNVSLYATINNGKDSYTMIKEVEFPQYIQPEINVLFSPVWLINQTNTLTEELCDEIDEQYIKWYVHYPNTEEDVVYSGKSIAITPREVGIMTVRIVNECSCAQRSERTYSFTVTGKLPAIMSFPNPVTTTILPIELNTVGVTISRGMNSYSSVNKALSVELWHEQFGRVRSINVYDSHISLDVGGLLGGWYQIILLHNGNVIESNVVYING